MGILSAGASGAKPKPQTTLVAPFRLAPVGQEFESPRLHQHQKTAPSVLRHKPRKSPAGVIPGGAFAWLDTPSYTETLRERG